MWSSSCQSGSKWTKVRYLHTFSAPSRPSRPSRRSTAPCPGAHESQGSILAAKRPLAFLDPLGGHLWLNRVEPPMISWFFPKQKGELSCTKLEKIWFWDDFSLRHLVKWSLNQIPSFNHLAYKKLPGGYIFLGGDAGMGWTYHPPNACGDQPLLRPWVWRREWHQWY